MRDAIDNLMEATERRERLRAVYMVAEAAARQAADAASAAHGAHLLAVDKRRKAEAAAAKCSATWAEAWSACNKLAHAIRKTRAAP